MRNDDTAERRLHKKTLKGWPRVETRQEGKATEQLHAATRVGKPGGNHQVRSDDTRVEFSPPYRDVDGKDEEIPELPSSLLELADEELLDEIEEIEAPSGDHRESEAAEGEEEPKNLLRIKAGSFSLELEGDADFINAVYDSVRDDLLTKMTASVAAQRAQTERKEPASSEKVDVTQLEKQIKVKGNGYVWVYVCHELYNKVHVVSRDTLAVSPLASVADTRRINKVYVNRARLPELESLIGSGKTLWSELTTEGRRRLRRGGL